MVLAEKALRERKNIVTAFDTIINETTNIKKSSLNINFIGSSHSSTWKSVSSRLCHSINNQCC